jgi:hypothetical protein
MTALFQIPHALFIPSMSVSFCHWIHPLIFTSPLRPICIPQLSCSDVFFLAIPPLYDAFPFFLSTPSFFSRSNPVRCHQLPYKLFAYIMTFLCNLPSLALLSPTHFIPPYHELRAAVVMSILSPPFLFRILKIRLGVGVNPTPVRVLQCRGVVSMLLLRSVDYYSSPLPPHISSHPPPIPSARHCPCSTLGFLLFLSIEVAFWSFADSPMHNISLH